MPSRLRNEVTPATISIVSNMHTSPLSSPKSFASPSQKQKMSITQTYYVASQARHKLSSEACKPDHNLRILVGHANLLDSLMINLADAEKEQEAWFNHSVSKAEEKPKTQHIQWADTIVESDEEEEDDASDSDSDSEFDDFEMELPARRFRAPPIFPETENEDMEPAEYEDYEDDEDHALVRTQSHPPELMHDDSDSEDESMPPSPPVPSFELTDKEKAVLATTSLQTGKDMTLVSEAMVIDQTTPLIASF